MYSYLFLKDKNIEWQVAFDDIRDAAYKLWPSLSIKEKGKYFRHLSPWYESHRFRLPPQTAQKLDDYRQQGKINYYAGSIIRVEVKNNFIQKSNNNFVSCKISIIDRDRHPVAR